jgi:hypothetical protein
MIVDKRDSKPSLQQLQNRVNRLEGILYIFAAVLAIAFAVTVYGTQQNAKAINTSHLALCTQQKQARIGLKEGKAFLLQHPDGTPDFSRSLILRSIKQSQEQLYALKEVKCT